jgi:hypothetical protein
MPNGERSTALEQLSTKTFEEGKKVEYTTNYCNGN